MRLYTIQTADLLPIEEDYYASFQFVQRNPFSCDDIPLYKWMFEKLSSPLKKSGTAPVWCWQKWNDRSDAPDLRYAGHAPRGTRCCRMEMEVPEEHVLLSQFEMWCWVLNGWNIIKNEKQREAPPFSLEESWMNIFDLEFGSEFMWGKKQNRSIQAIIPCIKPEWIIRMKIFIAR